MDFFIPAWAETHWLDRECRHWFELFSAAFCQSMSPMAFLIITTFICRNYFRSEMLPNAVIGINASLFEPSFFCFDADVRLSRACSSGVTAVNKQLLQRFDTPHPHPSRWVFLIEQVSQIKELVPSWEPLKLPWKWKSDPKSDAAMILVWTGQNPVPEPVMGLHGKMCNCKPPQKISCGIRLTLRLRLFLLKPDKPRPEARSRR